ncbi:hypothetical protein ABEB36_000916 [Hypothenemus hampei]|uniref:Uncharacterized protein n=1 Tax=Hypothenemus hampei TaxID=57062 RepID=A0ABD1FCV0_HYPHA
MADIKFLKAHPSGPKNKTREKNQSRIKSYRDTNNVITKYQVDRLRLTTETKDLWGLLKCRCFWCCCCGCCCSCGRRPPTESPIPGFRAWDKDGTMPGAPEDKDGASRKEESETNSLVRGRIK